MIYTRQESTERLTDGIETLIEPT